ncbi:transcriptional regulator LeuO [Vibrio ezurae]|uniref:Putative LysR family transcriptional regulator n=1 Tax=Vibrio ezurae NBRC 102218 TaxID=1219080 RepID=U3CBN3_9VIBR|nr:transcriptional regulator LeuO [Vibrio ezurae]GAD78729.1 putative LysR family transcriptional regulator [Vibrio ezurae NBRC 102218]
MLASSSAHDWQQSEDSKNSTLRGVDLNLLIVFDAVMQEQNITRAARNLNMSQPAVSNAVARLKVMFKDDLFMRKGRGISPTLRARQLSTPVRQALQLVRNELPGTSFDPETSSRTFSIAIGTPNDVRFAPELIKNTAKKAPSVKLNLDSLGGASLQEKLIQQEIDYIIGYTYFDNADFVSSEIFSDELVVICAKDHPRLSHSEKISMEQLLYEQHASLSPTSDVMDLNHIVYKDLQVQSSYRGATLGNLIAVAAQSELLCVVPRWVKDFFPTSLELHAMPFPGEQTKIRAYLTWHESRQNDAAHIWMRDQLMTVCGEVVAKG